VAASVFSGSEAIGRPPDDARVAAVAAADDARIAAMVTADLATLTGLLSADLHYAHSNGTVDTRESFLDLIESGRSKYLAYHPIERAYTFPAEGIAMVTGRARVTVENAAGRNELTLSFLSIWRKEVGGWRFLAWQSARLPAASPEAAVQPDPQAPAPAGEQAPGQPMPK
jgi:ketosteroid isomerase-like protein